MVKELQGNQAYLKMYPNIIIVEEHGSDNFKSFENSIKTSIGTYTYSNKISELLTNKNYLVNLLDCLKTDSSKVEICCIRNGEVTNIQSYPKAVFIEIITELDRKNLLNDVQNKNEILKVLNNSVSIDKLKKSNEEYSCEIDGKTCLMTVKHLINIIEDYKDLKFDSEFEIFDMNKNEFAYFIKNFAKDYSLQTNYVLPLDVAQFINDIEQDKIANTSYINRINRTVDPYIEKVVLNEELVGEVLNNMPKQYSKIEKAIYVYIKLCQILTYDEEFYAVGQKGDVAKRHENIERLSTITPEKNNIVCYEFTEIFGKILNLIDINFELFELANKNTYGSGHANITFKADEFIVDADSVTSILGGDMFRAKTNKQLLGLECANKNENIKKQFYIILNKVYNDIIKENSNLYLNKDESFVKWKDIFNNLVKGEAKLDIKYKFNLLENLIKNSKLPYLDRLSYAFNLSKIIFKQDIEESFFKISIVKVQEEKSYPIIIYSIKNNNSKKIPYEYKLFDIDGQIKEISKKLVSNNFNTQKFEYIKCESKHFVPGLDEGDEKC